MIVIRLDTRAFDRSLNRLLDQSRRPRRIIEAAAGKVRIELQRHFAEKNRIPNRLRAPKTGWWAAVARSTHVVNVTDRSAVVSISHRGIALQVYGGWVYPREKKALTIPVHPDAHGRRVKVFKVEGTPIFPIKTRDGRTYLARPGKGKGAFPEVLYRLSGGEEIPKDPTALPRQERLEEAALRAADEQLASEIRRAGLV